MWWSDEIKAAVRINGIAKRDEVVDVFRKEELLALTKIKLKGNEEVP